MMLCIDDKNLSKVEESANSPEVTSKIETSIGIEDEKLKNHPKSGTIQSDTIISKDPTFANILRLIMGAESVDEAKKIFFDNLFDLINSEEVKGFINEVHYDENGKRYTVDLHGRRMCYVSDLFNEILHDELSTPNADTREEHNNGELCNFLIEEKTDYSETPKAQSELGSPRTRKNSNKENNK